jgi:hypothetical protein
MSNDGGGNTNSALTSPLGSDAAKVYRFFLHFLPDDDDSRHAAGAFHRRRVSNDRWNRFRCRRGGRLYRRTGRRVCTRVLDEAGMTAVLLFRPSRLFEHHKKTQNNHHGAVPMCRPSPTSSNHRSEREGTVGSMQEVICNDELSLEWWIVGRGIAHCPVATNSE